MKFNWINLFYNCECQPNNLNLLISGLLPSCHQATYFHSHGLVTHSRYLMPPTRLLPTVVFRNCHQIACIAVFRPKYDSFFLPTRFAVLFSCLIPFYVHISWNCLLTNSVPLSVRITLVVFPVWFSAYFLNSTNVNSSNTWFFDFSTYTNTFLLKSSMNWRNGVQWPTYIGMNYLQ